MCQQVLARVLETARSLAFERERLDELRGHQLDEMRQLGQQGDVDVDRSSARRYYVGHLRAQIGEVERNQQLIERQLASCWQSLVKADQAVKVIEKLEERQRKEHLYQQERRSALTLDDIWTAARMTEAAG